MELSISEVKLSELNLANRIDAEHYQPHFLDIVSAVKNKQYKKLFAPLNIDVRYIYILNDWFRHPSYKDVLDYIISVDCQYYFSYLPLHKLGLPVPAQN